MRHEMSLSLEKSSFSSEHVRDPGYTTWRQASLCPNASLQPSTCVLFQYVHGRFVAVTETET